MYRNHSIINNDVIDVVSCVRTLTPNYRQIIDDGGQLPDNPYMLTVDSQNSPLVIRQEQYSYGKKVNSFSTSQTIQATWAMYNQANDYFNSLVEDLSINRNNKLLAKLKGQSLPILMLYKERHETFSMVKRFLLNAKYTVRYIKHPTMVLRRWGVTDVRPSHIRRLKYAVKRSKTYGDAFLQYRFAWSPLVSDIMDLFEAAAKYEKKGHDSAIKAGLPFNFTKEAAYVGGGFRGLPSICSCFGRYTVGCTYRITDATLASASQLMDIPTTAWDAVPWSFMIDRLVNISKYLDLRNAAAGVAFVKGYTSLKQTRLYNLKRTPYICDDYYQAKPAGANWSSWWVHTCVSGSARQTFTYNRQKLTAFPSPALEFPYREFFDGIKLADDIALLGQLLSRPLLR